MSNVIFLEFEYVKFDFFCVSQKKRLLCSFGISN